MCTRGLVKAAAERRGHSAGLHEREFPTPARVCEIVKKLCALARVSERDWDFACDCMHVLVFFFFSRARGSFRMLAAAAAATAEGV